MHPHTAARLLAASAMAALASPAIAQSVTVSLTHDDADGVVQLGETTTWTLAIGFEGFGVDAAASGGNMVIIGDNTLGNSSAMSYEAFNGGNNGGTSNGAGIGFVNWTNSLFIDVWDTTTNHSNPLLVGTFEFTATTSGALVYTIATGPADSAFVSVDLNSFQSVLFNLGDVGLTISADTLTIVPSPGSVAIFAISIPLVLVGHRHRS